MVEELTAQLQQIRSEMDEALADEIEAERKKPKSRIGVDGKLFAEQSNYYRYTFSFREAWESQDNIPLTINIPGHSQVKAELVSAQGTIIEIATTKPLPDEALQRIEIVDDPAELLKKLREVLKNSHEGAAQLGSKSFGLLGFARGMQPSPVTFGMFKPDPSQSRAIQMALWSEVTYIIGPPGTGKTLTLAAIAFTHLCMGRSVLIAAQTNIAVDNAIIKLSEICKDAGILAKLQAGLVVRYGHPQLRVLMEDSRYEDVYMPKIIKRRNSHLLQKREILETSLKQLIIRIQTQSKRSEDWYIERLRISKQCDTLQQELNQEFLVIEELEARRRALSNLLQQAQQRFNAARHELGELVTLENQLLIARVQYDMQGKALASHASEAKQMGAVKRFFKGINLKHLLEQLADVKQRLWHIDQTLAELLVRRDKAHRTYDATEKECKQLIFSYNELMEHRNIRSAKLAHIKSSLDQGKQRIEKGDAKLHWERQDREREYRQLEGEKESIEKQIAEIDTLLNDLEKRIVTEARVVATTLSKIYMAQVMNERRFDIVILDEVSMASLPAIYVAVSHADRSVVAIGDSYQLGPIVNAKEKQAEKWLGTDLFQFRNISLTSAVGGDKNSTLLKEQSRMHPSISKIVRRHVYQGEVTDAERIKNGSRDAYANIVPLPGKSLVLCDTSDGSPIVTKPEDGSRTNIYHAFCTLALVQQVCFSLPLPDLQNGQEQRIGVVTPYRKQAKLLQRLIQDAKLDKLVRVGTVHGFQGLEFDVVIFDTVESYNLEPTKNFTAGRRMTKAMRLINVAITRARHKLIIVANVSYLQDKLQNDDILLLAINDAQAESSIKSRDVVSTPFLPPDEVTGKGMPNYLRDLLSQEAANLGFYKVECFNDVDQFFEKCKHDILNAKKTIVMFCPYVALDRMKDMESLLAQKRQTNVDVTVITKPPKEMTNRTASRAMPLLKNTRVEQLDKGQMHEKLVIIDREIVYWGSLNILSHKDSSEFMTRVRAARFAEEVERSINLKAFMNDLSEAGKIVTKRTLSITHSLQELSVISPTCNKCHANWSAATGIYGPYYRCTQCRHKEDATAYHLSRIQELSDISCADCGSPAYIKKYPKQNGFLVCSVDCGYRQEIVFK